MDDRSPEVLSVAILFLVTSWIIVGVRVYVRAGMLKTFGSDDWAMVVTLLLFTGYLVCQIGSVIYGVGKHTADLDPDRRHEAMRYWYFGELFYVLSSCSLKIALGIFFLRFATTRMHIWIVRLLMLGTAVFATAYFFIVMFQCNPITDFWRTPIKDQHCISNKFSFAATYTASSLTIIADWTLIILPIFFVWHLKLDRNAKLYIYGILAFAAIGSTAAIVRIVYVRGLGNKHHFLWANTDIAIWSTVEPGVGIIAGCLATLRPLLQNLLWCLGFSSAAPGAAQRIGDRGRSQHQGRWGHHRRSHWLDDLRPDKVGTVTSVTGPSRSSKRDRSSSTERIFVRGITKEVRVEYTSTPV